MTPALPVIAAASTSVLVGIAIVATRFVLDQTDPASLALLRYSIGFLLLLPAILMSTMIRFRGRDILPIALLGIGQFGILIALLNYGLLYISSGLAALIFATVPLWTLLFSTLLRQETLTGYKAAGVVLTIIGVGLAVDSHISLTDQHVRAWTGELAVLGSALTGAVCSVLYRPYIRRYPTLQVSGFAMLASVAFLAIPAGWAGFFNHVPSFTLGGWIAVLVIACVSAVGYYTWLWALNHTTPTKVTVFLSLSPITATLLGWALMGEHITVDFSIGVALVAVGLWLAHRLPKSTAV